MRICVVGAGNVGLVTASCLAEAGHKVVLVEKDDKRLSALRAGRAPFYEPGLDDLLAKGLSSGTLSATGDVSEAVPGSEFTFVCVGTPNRRDGSQDLSQLRRAASEIGNCLSTNGYSIVVLRSTVLPGTTEGMFKKSLETAARKVAGQHFGLAMQPEFLREGSAIFDSVNPERVVIGEYDRRSGEALEAFYQEFYRHKVPIIRLSTYSAELVKYASNAFLATKVSFINEMANLCERIPTADIGKIANCMGLDSRIGPKFLKAGLGFGGSCLRKDAVALMHYADQVGARLAILRDVLRINEDRIAHVVEMIRRNLSGVRGRKIAVLGLSFKPGTDDIRDAPAIKLVRALRRLGAVISAYDPAAMRNAIVELGNTITCAPSVEDCLSGADCCVVATEWPEFKRLRPEEFVARMRHPLLIDARRVYEHDSEEFEGKLSYVAIGLSRKKHRGARARTRSLIGKRLP